jgi:Uncharacterised protein family (UPF0175)
MDDSIPDPRAGAYTEITVRIPDDLARRLGTVGEIECRALEALAVEEFKRGRLTKPELRRLLGFGARMKLNEFLKAHNVYEPYTLDDLEREREDLAAIVPDDESRARPRARQAAANIIARRKGVSLGGLSIKDLINEGRRSAWSSIAR